MGPRNQTQSVKNSSNAFSLGIASCIWGKVYTEEKIKELNEEEVEKLFNNYKAKLALRPDGKVTR